MSSMITPLVMGGVLVLVISVLIRQANKNAREEGFAKSNQKTWLGRIQNG